MEKKFADMTEDELDLAMKCSTIEAGKELARKELERRARWRLTMSEQEGEVALEQKEPSTMELYSNIIQLINHADQMRWNRFANFLTANAVILAVWAMIFTEKAGEFPVKNFILSLICIFGIVSCVLFVHVCMRASEYLQAYAKQAKELENKWPADYPKLIADNTRIKESGIGSELTVKVISYGFVAIYWSLLFILFLAKDCFYSWIIAVLIFAGIFGCCYYLEQKKHDDQEEK